MASYLCRTTVENLHENLFITLDKIGVCESLSASNELHIMHRGIDILYRTKSVDNIHKFTSLLEIDIFYGWKRRIAFVVLLAVGMLFVSISFLLLNPPQWSLATTIPIGFFCLLLALKSTYKHEKIMQVHLGRLIDALRSEFKLEQIEPMHINVFRGKYSLLILSATLLAILFCCMNCALGFSPAMIFLIYSIWCGLIFSIFTIEGDSWRGYEMAYAITTLLSSSMAVLFCCFLLIATGYQVEQFVGQGKSLWVKTIIEKGFSYEPSEYFSNIDFTLQFTENDFKRLYGVAPDFAENALSRRLMGGMISIYWIFCLACFAVIGGLIIRNTPSQLRFAKSSGSMHEASDRPVGDSIPLTHRARNLFIAFIIVSEIIVGINLFCSVNILDFILTGGVHAWPPLLRALAFSTIYFQEMGGSSSHLSIAFPICFWLLAALPGFLMMYASLSRLAKYLLRCLILARAYDDDLSFRWHNYIEPLVNHTSLAIEFSRTNIVFVEHSDLTIYTIYNILTQKHYIVVDQSLSKFLNQEEMAVLLVHETAHLSKDARQITVLKLLSCLLMLPGNTLTIFYPYEKRECEADRFVVHCIGDASALKSALVKLSMHETHAVKSVGKLKQRKRFLAFRQLWEYLTNDRILAASYMPLQDRLRWLDDPIEDEHGYG